MASKKPRDVGSRLKRERERRKLTQEQAADLLRVHRVSYAKWEAGTHAPRGLYADAVARFLAGE